MASRKKPASVEAYLAELDHPHKGVLLALRAAILGVDPRIREEVKWNAPSYALDDHFATFRLHPRATFQLILHTGARSKGPAKPMRLDDPYGLLTWPSPDRCVVALPTDPNAAEQRADVVRMVKDWIAQL